MSSNLLNPSDPIVSMSLLAGDPGLDSPRTFPKNPDESPLSLDQLLNGGRDNSKLAPTAPTAETETVYKSHARVFLIDSAGNSDYEDILNKGLRGDVILGKREICDIKGSPDFKVYLEWMVPSTEKKPKAKKS